MHQSDCASDATTCDRYAAEFAAWDGLLQAHATMARGLDADMRAAHGLPLSEFAVLLWLARGPCQQLRMTALAESALLSPSGVSRAVERLEARGLVRRQRCIEDRRGTFATLTNEGRTLIETAGATLAAGIRTRMLDRLTAEEQHTLMAVCQRLAATQDGEMAPSCPSEQAKGRETMATCTHLGEIQDVTPSAQGCEECLKTGSRWVHLRECLICGHVGCCDSSPNRHATRHFHETGHPIVQSFEPGEDWMWCYVDEVMIDPRRLPQRQ